MAGVDLGALGELDQPLQRAVEAFSPLERVDREVGTGRVADQQRVAGHQVAVDEVTAVLRPVAGRVHDADRDIAYAKLVAILDRVERVLRLGQRMDADRQPVLEREPPVPGEVVGMGVRLEHTHDAYAAALRLLEVRLDHVGRVDDHRLAALLIPDQIGRAAEILVDALMEDHCKATVPTAPASFLEVTSPAVCRRFRQPVLDGPSTEAQTGCVADLGRQVEVPRVLAVSVHEVAAVGVVAACPSQHPRLDEGRR